MTKVYKTSDGYKFYVQPSGKVTDTKDGKNFDMSFKSIDAMFKELEGDVKLVKSKAKGGSVKKFASGGAATKGFGKVIK